MKRIIAVGMLVLAQAMIVIAQNGLQLPSATKPVIISYLPQVADLEKTERFYHQLLGLESVRGDPQARSEVWFPTRPSLAFLEDMYGISGKLRNVFLDVPVSNLVIQAVQWANAKGKPLNPRLQDPGATLLVLKVNNIDALTRRMVKGGAKVITTGGIPVAEGDLAVKKRVIVFEDFNGFFTELVQVGIPQVVTDEGPMSVIEGGDITVTVSDLDTNAKFYSEILGLEVKSDTAFSSETAHLNALGIKGAEYREARIIMPDKTPQLHLVEFRGIERKTLTPLVPDPNSTVLRVTVPDFESVLAKIRTSPDVKIMNTGGRPVSPFADGSGRFLIVRPPGGSTYLQLTELRRQK